MSLNLHTVLNRVVDVLVVDDQASASAHLRALLEENFVRRLQCRTAFSAADARQLIAEKQPDLLFLDVEMPGENGFQLLESLGDDPPLVIFVTAYQEFAIQALKASAIDYLLKPVDLQELSIAMTRAFGRLQEGHLLREKLAQFDRLQALKQNLQSTEGLGKLVLSEANGTRILESDQICYLEGARNYSRVHLIDGTSHTSSRNLAVFEKMLANQGFCRVHKSCLVRLAAVKSTKNNSIVVQMAGETKELPVSRRRKKEFLLKFSQFLKTV